MPAYEPKMANGAMVNVFDEREFRLKIVFGAGVVASYKGKDLTLARNTNGNYTVTLPRTYRQRTGFSWGWAKYAAGAVFFPVILTDSSATASATGGGTLVIETRTEAGVATDPATGNELELRFFFTNDVLND